MPIPTDAELVNMLECSGYDPSLVHPDAYRSFSYKNFTERLIRYVLADVKKSESADHG